MKKGRKRGETDLVRVVPLVEPVVGHFNAGARAERVDWLGENAGPRKSESLNHTQ